MKNVKDMTNDELHSERINIRYALVLILVTYCLVGPSIGLALPPSFALHALIFVPLGFSISACFLAYLVRVAVEIRIRELLEKKDDTQ